jgi:hypothetical protein
MVAPPHIRDAPLVGALELVLGAGVHRTILLVTVIVALKLPIAPVCQWNALVVVEALEL